MLHWVSSEHVWEQGRRQLIRSMKNMVREMVKEMVPGIWAIRGDVCKGDLEGSECIEMRWLKRRERQWKTRETRRKPIISSSPWEEKKESLTCPTIGKYTVWFFFPNDTGCQKRRHYCKYIGAPHGLPNRRICGSSGNQTQHNLLARQVC